MRVDHRGPFGVGHTIATLIQQLKDRLVLQKVDVIGLSGRLIRDVQPRGLACGNAQCVRSKSPGNATHATP